MGKEQFCQWSTTCKKVLLVFYLPYGVCAEGSRISGQNTSNPYLLILYNLVLTKLGLYMMSRRYHLPTWWGFHSYFISKTEHLTFLGVLPICMRYLLGALVFIYISFSINSKFVRAEKNITKAHPHSVTKFH